ncbi:MAG: hypothetical protein B7Y39_01500 [Bdellovibrio sp. 28-41-41]|nr:MAG: hypothetical protein B7Y39_01500 [Bdellovibrio sp. 28-41-41]
MDNITTGFSGDVGRQKDPIDELEKCIVETASRGEALINGAKKLKIHGEYVEIKAQVKVLDNISAHADYAETIDWLKQSQISRKRTFVTHGEPTAADEMRKHIIDSLDWDCVVPLLNETFELT